MAANTRIRIEPDIEAYLRSQAQRVLGVDPEKVTAADMTTLTNRIIYEHKLAQSMMRQEFIPRLFGWLKGVFPNAGGNKVVAIAPESQPAILPPADDLDFAAEFASQFEDDAA